MRIFFYIILIPLTFFWYKEISITINNSITKKVLYPNMFYNLSGYTINVITWETNYNNQQLTKNNIYFLGDKKLKDDFDWKQIIWLNVTWYNKLSQYNYKYKQNNLIFIK